MDPTRPARPRRAADRPRGKAAPSLSLGADEAWRLSAIKPAITHFRRHLEIDGAGGAPAARLPIVITPGTHYTAVVDDPVAENADPVDPRRPKRAPARRLTLGVGVRDDLEKGARQRDKVELAFHDETRARDLRVDIESAEPRYIAFDVQFDPAYELAPANYYVIHFQALQFGMHRSVMRDAGQPPFSIRVQGTTPGRPDPLAPIELKLERRWSDARGEVQEEVLADRLPPLERGRWYRFVLRLQPGTERGDIGLWHWDLERAYDRCDGPIGHWAVPWGYRPTPSGDPKLDTRRRTIQYALGIYRHSSPSTQLLHFRNIRYGTTYDAVVPGPAC